MNKILISSVAAAVLATVSGAALASSAVYVNLSSLLNVSSTGTPFFSNPLIF
jgi:hypothetical protein